MSAAEDAGLDAVAAIEAKLRGDGAALDVILGSCDQRAACEALAAISAHAISLLGPQNRAVLLSAYRRASLGQAVRLVSDGQRFREEPRP